MKFTDGIERKTRRPARSGREQYLTEHDLDDRILRFIRKHHVMTLSTCREGRPWCAQCFYVLLEKEMALGFASDPGTRHIREGLANARTAASIVLETGIVGKIQGVQMEGILRRPPEDLRAGIARAYCRRFPAAAVMDVSFWAMEIDSVKMTDNLPGFGKKRYWRRPQ